MGQRLKLQTLLESVLGSRNVYFQPPKNIQMLYPCIVYSLSNIRIDNADNDSYRHTKRYSVMLIDRNPDSSVVDKLSELPMCSFSRAFTLENLHHTVFDLYFQEGNN